MLENCCCTFNEDGILVGSLCLAHERIVESKVASAISEERNALAHSEKMGERQAELIASLEKYLSEERQEHRATLMLAADVRAYAEELERFALASLRDCVMALASSSLESKAYEVAYARVDRAIEIIKENMAKQGRQEPPLSVSMASEPMGDPHPLDCVHETSTKLAQRIRDTAACLQGFEDEPMRGASSRLAMEFNALACEVERMELRHQSNSNALRTLADACECGPEDDPPKRCRFCDVADLLVGNDSNRDPDRARPECPMGPQPCHNPACAERCNLVDPVEGINGGYPRQGVGECHQVGRNVPAEPVKVFQTDFGELGNCQSACLATLLGLSIDEVPNWTALTTFSDNEKYRAMQRWLRDRGWHLFTVNAIPQHGYCIAGGKSARGLYHAVIYRDGRSWHDPHPDGGGLIHADEADLLVPIAPHTCELRTVAGKKP